jgi:DNA-binding protein Fis
VGRRRTLGRYLLRLEGQLDEDLLQLLVHEVDAELFKAVFLSRK